LTARRRRRRGHDAVAQDADALELDLDSVTPFHRLVVPGVPVKMTSPGLVCNIFRGDLQGRNVASDRVGGRGHYTRARHDPLQDVLEIPPGWNHPDLPEIDDAIVDAAAIDETPGAVEHGNLGRHLHTRERNQLVLQVPQGPERIVILQSVLSQNRRRDGRVRIHEPELRVLGEALVESAHFWRVPVGDGAIVGGENKNDDLACRLGKRSHRAAVQIDEAHVRGRDLLTTHKAKLVQLARRLMVQETLEGKELETLFASEPPPLDGEQLPQRSSAKAERAPVP